MTVIAPLVAAVVIGLVIRSPYVLVFAALSPIIAIASTLEGRRVARREARAEAMRFDAACETFLTELARAHDEETRAAFCAAVDDPDSIVVAAVPRPSAVLSSATSVTAPDDGVVERLRALRTTAAINPRMPLTVPVAPTRVQGIGPVAARLRSQLPSVQEGQEGGAWSITVTGLATVTVVSPTGECWAGDAVVPLSIEHAHQKAQRVASEPPERCLYSSLTSTPGSPALPIGRDAGGVVAVDLTTDGPHLIVGGASGSGKSEFLRALALSAAERIDHWRVLFVDFKGGATFADLTDLPAAVGLITDLDAALADRALGSLRAEIRRREGLLADLGARDIADLGGRLTRLLIVVDEYAALVQTHPDLQPVFADLSARGRSLGMHLVLCTQRPGGVVHDQVTVNCGLRVMFRTTDAADARALVGAAVPGLDRAPRGRAVILRDGVLRSVQSALVQSGDIERVRARTAAARADAPVGLDTPWSEPLPAHLSSEDQRVRKSELSRSAIAFGAVDDVAHQRWIAAEWLPERDGVLGVVGCPGSGRTTALAAVARGAAAQGWRVRRLPATLADAVQALEVVCHEPPAPQRTLVIMDEFAAMLEGAPPERSSGLLARWDDAARALRAHGGAVAVDLGTATGSARWASGRIGVRLVLRALDQDDHVTAGGPRGRHDHRAPAGRGWWHTDTVHVFAPEGPGPWLGDAIRCEVPTPFDRDVTLAIVSANPAAASARVRREAPDRPQEFVGAGAAATGAAFHTSGAAHAPPRGAGVSVPGVLIGHPDDWQRAFSALSDARRHALIVLDGVDIADARALLGARVEPAPLEPGELWLVEPGGASSPRLTRGRWARATGETDDSGVPGHSD